MKIIVIVGPTGVGKTKLSILLAHKYNAEIINADSMQVYKDLNIGTAKIKEDEKEGIIHHLFDIVDVCDDYSVFEYQRDCRKKIKEIKAKNKNVIIVGGTGLYIKAALFDYKFSKGTLNNTYDNMANSDILDKIKTYQVIDLPHVNNRKRLVRLLNKLENSEEITYNKDKILYDSIFIGLSTDRNTLYDRINKRVDKMFDDGLVDEVEKEKDNFTKSKALMTGIGYKEFYDYFYNGKDLKLVKDEIKKNSRHYAKRQFTFFNNQLDVKWFDANFDNFSDTVNEIFKYIGENYE